MMVRDKITVWLGGKAQRLVRACVTGIASDWFYYVNMSSSTNDVSRDRGALFIKDEGLTWCSGWEGPQVAALRVVRALR